MADPDFIAAVRASADRLGINPSDLLTSISYETGGKLSPSLWGGKNNNYLGLIQFGPEERAKYGVNEKQSAVEQMGAVENFLRDRGVKPGMGLLDVYSTINAGSPGRYNASDANNGGAPGTVANKVAYQMVGHRARANALLGVGGNRQPQAAPQSAPPATQVQQAPQAPQPAAVAASPPVSSPSPDMPASAAMPSGDAGGGDDAVTQSLAGLQKIPELLAQNQDFQPIAPAQTINFPVPANVARARALAAAMRARQLG